MSNFSVAQAPAFLASYVNSSFASLYYDRFYLVFRISPSLHQSTMIFSLRDWKMTYLQILVHKLFHLYQLPELVFLTRYEQFEGADTPMFLYTLYMYDSAISLSCHHFYLIVRWSIFFFICRDYRVSNWGSGKQKSETGSGCAIYLLGQMLKLGFKSFYMRCEWIECCKCLKMRTTTLTLVACVVLWWNVPAFLNTIAIRAFPLPFLDMDMTLISFRKKFSDGCIIWLCRLRYM